MTVDGQLFIEALKAQRNAALDQAATLKAALDTAQARIAELESQLAKAKEPAPT